MANTFTQQILKAKWWVKLLLSIIFLLLFFLFINWLLKYSTNHGQSLPVPKLKGLTFEEATKLLDENKLDYVIFDSVYVPKAKKDEVVEQNPAEGSMVKKHRKIYLTINARPVPIVKMPDIMDINLREAVNKLQSAGLEVGEITTRPDITVNRVLDVMYKGKRISPGTELEKGSRVDMVVSEGEDNEGDIVLSDLGGLTLEEARGELGLLGLNIGVVTYDKDVTDKNKALIYKQTPAAGAKVYLGKEIDLYLKQE